MSFKSKLLLILSVTFLVVFSQSVFIVYEGEQVLIERFGDIKKSYTQSGLKFKLPFIDSVKPFEKRFLNAESDEIQAILADKKQLFVDAFARYQIVDPLKFYQSLRDLETAKTKLETILNSATRSVLGKEKLTDILSGERVVLMDDIRKRADSQTNALGIKIIDVRIRHADLPSSNSESVFNRMKAERQQQAAQFRAEGQQKSVEITSEADKKGRVILAEAKKKSEILRGEADKTRNRIYAEAFSRDTEFFEFYRSMQAYEKALGSDDKSTIIMSTDTNFTKYLK